MKCAILDCFSNEYSPIFSLTKGSKQRYCDKFGLDFLFFNFELKDRTQHWGRILGIKKYLEQYDYLIYLDTDSLIVNFELNIKDIIAKFEGKKIITGPLPSQGHIGTNGLIFEKCDWSFEFLDEWYSQNQFIDSPYCGSPSRGLADDGGFDMPPEKWLFYEQSAFHFLYDTRPDVRLNTVLIERSYFHSVPKTFKRGDFLIHVPGRNKRSKLALLKRYLTKMT
jgi:hypothetical protein